jgi:large subunit ribosomal protein L30e
MDVERALKTAVSTGDVRLGTNMAMKTMKEGKAKLVVMAANCPSAAEMQSVASGNGVKVYVINVAGTELGTLCGKPFAVSALAVVEAGSSDILSILQK